MINNRTGASDQATNLRGNYLRFIGLAALETGVFILGRRTKGLLGTQG
jgi:hypothetical protein